MTQNTTAIAPEAFEDLRMSPDAQELAADLRGASFRTEKREPGVYGRRRSDGQCFRLPDGVVGHDRIMRAIEA